MPPTKQKGRPGREAAPDDKQPDGRTVAATVPRLDDVRPSALRAWAAACSMLAAAGVRPLPPWHVERALRRRGWWPRDA